MIASFAQVLVLIVDYVQTTFPLRRLELLARCGFDFRDWF